MSRHHKRHRTGGANPGKAAAPCTAVPGISGRLAVAACGHEPRGRLLCRLLSRPLSNERRQRLIPPNRICLPERHMVSSAGSFAAPFDSSLGPFINLREVPSSTLVRVFKTSGASAGEEPGSDRWRWWRRRVIDSDHDVVVVVHDA